jgi:hypothetical protein
MARGLIAACACGLALLAGGCGPASAPEASPTRDWDGLEAGIAAAHLTQAAQDLGGSVPLVRGKDALLRVFLGARRPGLPAPAVRARLVSTTTGATLRSYQPTSPLEVIPTGRFEGMGAATWNAVVPGDHLQPDRHLVVEIDPIPGVDPALLAATLRVPAVGSLDVRTVPPLPVTLVPIVQAGLAPDVDRSRTPESWVAFAAAVYPLPGIEVEVAPAYTTSLVLDGTSAAWSELLAELEALRAAQGSTRHWIGAVRTTGSGVAGRGSIGGAALVASDAPGHYQRIVAHELGHNLGLRHAPCGTDEGLDPAWPLEERYDGARTGVAGWDARDDRILDPRTTYDLMSYCGGPDDTWISDVTYLKALDALVGTGAGSP